MPVPKPNKGESKEDFISRCMSNETMKSEYDDNDQRLAICYTQWKNKDKKDLAMEKESRVLEIKDLKLEKREKTNLPKITGYAAVFNSLSEDLGGFREKIRPGAFKSAIKKSDARALVNHDTNMLLGRQSSGTLRLKEDTTGLYMEIDPPDTQYARDLINLIDRGDIREQSFGFTVRKDSWENIEKGQEQIRTLEEIDMLYDVSPVVFPAYPDTSVALRSLEAAKQIEPEIENNEPDNPDENIINRCVGILSEAIKRIGTPTQSDSDDNEPEPMQGRKIENWSEVEDRIKKYNEEHKL